MGALPSFHPTKRWRLSRVRAEYGVRRRNRLVSRVSDLGEGENCQMGESDHNFL